MRVTTTLDHDPLEGACAGALANVLRCYDMAARGHCTAVERALTFCVLRAHCPAEADSLAPCLSSPASDLVLRQPVNARCKRLFSRFDRCLAAHTLALEEFV